MKVNVVVLIEEIALIINATHQMEDIMANIIIAGVLLAASCIFIFVYNRK
jgi:hypothetical protein